MNSDNAGHTRWLPGKLRRSLARSLEDGEQVVWFEQPQARRWRRKGYSALLFGLAALALVWRAWPSASGGWYWWSGFLLLPALILIALPWLMHAHARSTLYAITNRRALILTAVGKNALKSYPVQQLPELIMRPHIDGTGDLVLETEYIDDADGCLQMREYGFDDIRDVGLVWQILEDLKLGKDVEQVRRRAALWRAA